MNLFRSLAIFLVGMMAVEAISEFVPDVKAPKGGVEKRHASYGRKSPWEDLVGVDADEAVAAIKKEHPELVVHKVPHGSMVTMDFRTDRVRVFYSPEGKVTSPPRIG